MVKLKYNTEIFIDKSNIIHNFMYDYSKVKYSNIKNKVKIICKKHGEFEQSPEKHLIGRGCPKCNGGVKISEKQFIDNLKLKFGDIYDYSKINYINTKIKVTLICKKHGEFNSIPSNLSKGHGCPKCAGNVIHSTNDILSKFIDRHGDRYDYSKVNYITAKHKVTIICKEHGEFEQIPKSHFNGSGCPKCSMSKGESLIATELKKLNINFIFEHIFDDCINYETKQKLRFDFYLPNHNLLIEYDGIQHFEGIELFGGSKAMELTKKRDSIKNEYALHHNIKMIRFNYKMNNDEIKKILANL